MKDYKKIYEEQFGSLDASKSQLETNQGKINNYKARLAASGIDPDEALDTRNKLEKALNLTPNQNTIFDIFELVTRPQQAIFGGIESMQNGEDFSEGAKQGIKGNKKTQFKDILMNTGAFDDTTIKDASKETDSKVDAMLKSIDLVDILGFAGDIFLDPMNIPLIPVAAASKGAKALNIASDASKSIEMISPTQALGKVAKGAIKGGAKLADTGVEKALTKIDAKKGINYINPNSKWATELGRLGDDKGLLETYKGLKNNLTTMFDTKLSRTARQSQKINNEKERMAEEWLSINAENINNVFKNTSEKLGKTVDEVNEDINKIVDVVDEITMDTVIRNAKDGTIKYSDEIYDKLVDIANDLPDDAERLIDGIHKTKSGKLKLDDVWTNRKVLSMMAPEKLGDKNKVKRVSFLTKKEQNEIAKLTKYYEENAPEAIQVVRDFYNNGNDYIASQFDTMKNLGKKFNESNIEGYSKHKVSDNYDKQIMELNKYGVNLKDLENQLISNTNGNMISGTGSKTLNSRKYYMSAQEANKLKKEELLNLPGISKEGKKFVKDTINLFDTNASAGIQSYITQIPKLAKNTQLTNDILLGQGLGDVNRIVDLKKSIDNGVDIEKNTLELNKLLDNSPFRLVDSGKAPYGFVKFDGDKKDYVVNFLKSTSKKTGNKKMFRMAQKLNGIDNLAIDPTVLNIIKVSDKTSKSSEFSKMYNKLMNFFKGNSTASFTNQLNNITGNMTNMYLSGMSMSDISKYSNQALKELNGWEKILKKGVTDVTQLTDDELKIYNNLKGFQQNVNLLDNASILEKYNIDDVMKAIQKKDKKNPLELYVKFFADLNASEDRLFKYATYLKAKDDPKFLKNLGIEAVDELGRALSKEQQAGMAVGKILFDPTDLTAFEKNTMKNVIPFYNFAKKNLAFQINNMGDNLQNYNKLMKAYNSIKDSYADDYDNMEDYIKDNMYIPIPGIDKDGNYQFVRAQLTVNDLVDFTSDPLSALVNRSNPLFKGIYENVANKNTYTDADIESFPGQKAKDLPILEDISESIGIDLLPTRKQEQLFNNMTGLNALLRQIDRGYSGYEDNGPLGILSNNIFQTGNVDTDKLNKSYDDLESLQNLMKQYEQKGYEFSTISELRKANKNNTIAGIDAILAKYGVGEKTTYNTGNKYYDYYMNNYR